MDWFFFWKNPLPRSHFEIRQPAIHSWTQPRHTALTQRPDTQPCLAAWPSLVAWIYMFDSRKIQFKTANIPTLSLVLCWIHILRRFEMHFTGRLKQKLKCLSALNNKNIEILAKLL